LIRGEAIVLTAGEAGQLRVSRLDDYINLLVPQRCLSPLIADLDDAYGRRPIPAASPALQPLTRYLGILQEAGTFAVPELRRHVVHIHDLIALAIGATRDAAEIAKSRGARAARLRAIKEDIATRSELRAAARSAD
jgi:hypothetical protein